MQKKEKEMEVTVKHVNNARRGFLKSAAYAAPTIVALGALTKPTDAKAFTKPPSAPNWP